MSAVSRRTPRQSGAGSSATLLNWRSGGAVISSQPISLGVSMRPTFVSRVVGATSTEPSIPPAPRSTSCSRGCAMPLRPNACSARRWRLRRIHRPGLSIRTERVSTMSAILAVQEQGPLRRRCRHRLPPTSRQPDGGFSGTQSPMPLADLPVRSDRLDKSRFLCEDRGSP